MAKASWKLCSISGLQTPSASADAKSFSSYHGKIKKKSFIISKINQFKKSIKNNRVDESFYTSLERSSGESGNSPAMLL